MSKRKTQERLTPPTPTVLRPCWCGGAGDTTHYGVGAASSKPNTGHRTYEEAAKDDRCWCGGPKGLHWASGHIQPGHINQADAPRPVEGSTLGPRPTTGGIAFAERMLDLSQREFARKGADLLRARGELARTKARLVVARIEVGKCPNCGVTPEDGHACDKEVAEFFIGGDLSKVTEPLPQDEDDAAKNLMWTRAGEQTRAFWRKQAHQDQVMAARGTKS